MRLLGRDITWSEPPETENRSLDQITITDIGLAFTVSQAAAIGLFDTAIPAIYRAETMIADLVSSLQMVQLTDGQIDRDTPDLLTQPDRNMSYRRFMLRLIYSLLRKGNAYLIPMRRDRAQFVQSVYIADPQEVTVVWDRARLYPEYAWRNKPLEVNKEIFHIEANLDNDGLTGVGPRQAAQTLVEEMFWTSLAVKNLFRDDATPPGTIDVPQMLTRAEADALVAQWIESHGDNKRPAVLSGGAKWNPLAFKPVDAELVAQREFAIQEVARIYGLSGFFLSVAMGQSMTYSTTESLFRLLITQTLNPSYLEPIEQAFSMMLPQLSEARFYTDELLRADIQTRYSSYQVGVHNGWLRREEVRQAEHLPYIPEDELAPLPDQPVGTGDQKESTA